MNVKISFKKIEHTESLDQQIHWKSEKFEKYFDGNIELHWTCYAKGEDHIADVKLLGPSFTYHACGKSNSLYKSLDIVVHKLEKQIIRKKDKWKNNIHQKHNISPKQALWDEMLKDELDQQEFEEFKDIA